MLSVFKSDPRTSDCFKLKAIFIYLNDEADGERRRGIAEVRSNMRPDLVVRPDGVRLVPGTIAQRTLDLVRLLLPFHTQEEAVGKRNFRTGYQSSYRMKEHQSNAITQCTDMRMIVEQSVA